MFAQIAEAPIKVTLYTDAYVIRGTATSRHRRVSDILNTGTEEFIVLSAVSMDEWGSTAAPVHADYAQVNLGSVLFAVADEPVEPTPELRLVKIPEQAFISVPPFRVVGNIHLPPEQDMRLALRELTGRFVPVTDATFWSDTVGEAKQSAVMVAVNHSRAQILAPHTDVDPWAGLDRSARAGRDALAGAASAFAASGGAIADGPGTPATPAPGGVGASSEPGARDPWGAPATPAAADPWTSSAGQDSWANGPTPTPTSAPAAPGQPAVPPSRTGLLGRVHSTTGATLDLPRPVDEPGTWDDEKGQPR
jgi:hypothetical protein